VYYYNYYVCDVWCGSNTMCNEMAIIVCGNNTILLILLLLLMMWQ